VLPGFLSDRPVWQAFTALYLVATLRGQATYWLARLVTEQADRRIGRRHGGRLAAVRRWLEGESVARGRRAIRRWGLPAVPLCYLTVGFQTLVLAAAGVLRVRWVAFTLAQLPGALAWAAIYTTIGWAAWQALLHLR
jgi:membrane protein DedA with SNARE-associated domain